LSFSSHNLGNQRCSNWYWQIFFDYSLTGVIYTRERFWEEKVKWLMLIFKDQWQRCENFKYFVG
jgi:hypothetical protein